MSAYWPPLQNLPNFDVTLFRDAQDVVDYAVATGTATNIAGGTAGALLYQSAPSNTAKLPIGANTYVLTSNGSTPVWTAPPVIPGTPTLSQVLTAGNSAGSSNIDMNSQNITNATSITATTFNGSLNGLASQSTTVAVTDTNAATTYYPVFCTGSSGQKSLLLDSLTGPLSYTPSSGTLSALVLTVGTSPNNSYINQPATVTQYVNNATSSQHKFYVNDATPTQINTFSIASNFNTSSVPFAVSYTGGSVTTYVNVPSSGYFNGISDLGDNMIVTTSGAIGTETLTLTTWSNTSCGVRINPTSLIIGSGGVTRPPANNITFDGTANTITVTALNCPTQSGYTVPAASDSSSKIATTQWVQSAITSGTSAIANTIALTSDDSTTTCYIPFSKTTSATSNILYIDDVTTPLRYRPDTGEVSAQRVTIGGILNPVAGDIATRFLQFTGANAVFEMRNQATSGRIRLVTLDATNTAINVVTLSTTEFTTITTNNPTITGFTDPASSNSSSNIATTRWVQSAITAGTVSLANNISGGTAGALLYQSAPNVTAKLGIGANNFILTSNGSAPTWSAQTISTTETSSLVYYLVGSTSQTTSTDTTLYKSNVGNGVYVNAATNVLISEGLGVNNSIGDNFTIKFDTPTGDDFIFVNNGLVAPAGNRTLFKNIDSSGITRTVLTLDGNAGASTFDGLSAASTTIAVADNDTATTMYPIFTTATAGQKSLLFDSTTTPLRYKPSTGELSAIQYSVGGILEPVAGNNAGFLAQNTGSSATVVQNQATSGLIHLAVRNGANALTNSVVVSATDAASNQFSVGSINNPVAGNNAGFLAQNTGASATVIQNQATSGKIYLNTRDAGSLLSTVAEVSTVSSIVRSPLSVVAGVVGSAATFTVSDTGTRSVVFIPNASAGALNSLAVLNDSLLYATAGTVGTGALTLSVWSATTNGVRITPTSAVIGAGGTASTPTAAISCSGTTVSIIGDPVVEDNNILVNNQTGNPITVGNGASTASYNILMSSGSLASTRNFTTGGNTLIGQMAGNALVVASANNTIIGDNAGTLASGSRNTIIGFGAEVPTAANSNQIAIGTASETLYVRGGFNWRVGTQITASITLTAPLAQFYTVAMAAATQTITLPAPNNTTLLGQTVTFKRKTNTTAFTLAAGAGTPLISIGSITAVATIAVATTTFQVTLVCDGVNWDVINQT